MGRGNARRKPVSSADEELRFRETVARLRSVLRGDPSGSGAQLTPESVRETAERLIALLSDPGMLALLAATEGVTAGSLTPAQAHRVREVIHSGIGREVTAALADLGVAHQTLRSLGDWLASTANRINARERQTARDRDRALQADAAQRTAFLEMLRADSASLVDIAEGRLSLPEELPLHALTFGLRTGFIVEPDIKLGQWGKQGRQLAIPLTVGDLRAQWADGYRFQSESDGRTGYGLHVPCRYLGARPRTRSWRDLERNVHASRMLVPRRLAAERAVAYAQAQQTARELGAAGWP